MPALLPTADVLSRCTCTAFLATLPLSSAFRRRKRTTAASVCLLLGLACCSVWLVMSSLPECSMVLLICRSFRFFSCWYSHLSGTLGDVGLPFSSDIRGTLCCNLVAHRVGRAISSPFSSSDAYLPVLADL